MLAGLHRVSVLPGAPQRTANFYAGTLGLRPVKRTVNVDDPGTHHLYFGDTVGRPGVVLSAFPCRDGRDGVAGAGQVSGWCGATVCADGHYHRTFLARGHTTQY